MSAQEQQSDTKVYRAGYLRFVARELHIPFTHVEAVVMAGRVRQPIDEKALEKYLRDNVPEVKTPVELKQVS